MRQVLVEDGYGGRLSESEAAAEARSLMAEGNALAALRHPHILTPIAIISEQLPALVLELAAGGTLWDFIQCAPCRIELYGTPLIVASLMPGMLCKFHENVYLLPSCF